MISDRLKNLIFKKLYTNLGRVEIIRYNNNIWFIDRETKFWYFNYYTPENKLWWRGSFFLDFFNLFSIDQSECTPIISEWVEEVLNCKINTTSNTIYRYVYQVEEVLNCKVNATEKSRHSHLYSAVEALNCKVNSTKRLYGISDFRVEEALNCKVDITVRLDELPTFMVDETPNI